MEYVSSHGSTYPRVRIRQRDHHSAELVLDQQLVAGRRPSEVTARLQRHIGGSALQLRFVASVDRVLHRNDLSVTRAGLLMESFADDLTAGVDDHARYPWIRRRRGLASLSKRYSTSHEGEVGVGKVGGWHVRLSEMKNLWIQLVFGTNCLRDAQRIQ